MVMIEMQENQRVTLAIHHLYLEPVGTARAKSRSIVQCCLDGGESNGVYLVSHRLVKTLHVGTLLPI